MLRASIKSNTFIFIFTSGAIRDKAWLAGAVVAPHKVRTVGIFRADPNCQTLVNICAEKMTGTSQDPAFPSGRREATKTTAPGSSWDIGAD